MSNAPKILTLDIETSPNLADVWGLWQQNVSLNQLRESTRMICFGAKWHHLKTVQFASEFHNGRADMLARAHALLSEADIVVHYNGGPFDMKHMRREFLLAGLNPTPPVQEVDLLSVVRNRFKFPSNKLAYVADVLNVGGKMSHEGHELWVKCMAGEPKAWATMRAYCVNDVRIEERVYDELLKWIPAHPNMNLYGDDPMALACPRCSSTDVQRRGQTRTLTRIFQRYQCQGCGSWFRAARSSGGASVRAAA